MRDTPNPNRIVDDLIELGRVAEYRCYVCRAVKDLYEFKKDDTHEVWWTHTQKKPMHVLVNHGEQPTEQEIARHASA